VKNSGSKKISERYVLALFEVATAANAVAAVEKDLQNLSTLLKENSDFVDFINNPLLTRAAKSKIAGAVLKNISAHKITAQFISLLAAQKRLDLLSEMIKLFIEKSAISRGEMAAELVVARAVSDAETAKISASLSKAYNKKINLNVREDANLLGGVVINVGSVRLDSSLAGKLTRLQQSLKVA
jgi:F-type H+-transporting ATPase subunit delta